MTRELFSRYMNFRSLQLFFLFAILVCLPLSKYLSSAAQILLAAAWLAEGQFSDKWRRIKSNPQILVFTLLFIVPLVGLTYSEDIGYGLRDLRVKLPLLFLPLVIGSMRAPDARELRVLLLGFVAAVVIGAIISLSIMMGIGPAEYTGDRESVLFISHIRFALMVVLAVFILFYYIGDSATPRKWLFGLLPAALFLVAFLFVLKSLTGVVILAAGGLLLSLLWGLRQKDLLARWFVIVGLATLPVLGAFYLTNQISRFYTLRDAGEPHDMLTVKGNPYWHDMDNTMIENGYRVGLYQCQTELRAAWNSVSSMDYDGPDRKGQELKYTLMRYLTSLGLRKDAHGISRLEPEDIRLIENGFANCMYRNPGNFSVRVYETIWEIDQYRKGANPSGHSVTQRLEYLRTGWSIFLDHPLFGVGTGDVQQAFSQKYEEMNSRLDPAWRLRAHNQLLTFLISSGIVGFLLLALGVLVPLLTSRRANPYFVRVFLLIALLSMLNEDTLETQAGVAFFAVFYCLFVFAGNQQVAEPAGTDR